MAVKTRCKQCYHIGANATQKPCSECAEIQFNKKNYDNQFLDSSKNLMQESK